jgi:hypothetical protein
VVDHTDCRRRMVSLVGETARPWLGGSKGNSFLVLEDAYTACSHQSSKSFGVSETERRRCGGKGPVFIGPTG